MDNEEERKEKFNKIKIAVQETLEFVRVKLRSRSDVRKETLDDLETVLTNFLKFKGAIPLYEALRSIESRPSKEGEDTDYTFGISVEFKGEYKTLFDHLESIYSVLDKYLGYD